MGTASAKNRNPTKQWELLMTICDGRGSFRWKAFGDFDVAKQLVASLRKTLRADFGIEEAPFERVDGTFRVGGDVRGISGIAGGMSGGSESTPGPHPLR